MAANSLLSVKISCNQRLPSASPYRVPKLFRRQSTNGRLPCPRPLSVRCSSTPFILPQLAGGDATAEVRSKLNVVNILENRGIVESLSCDSVRSACSDPDLPPLKAYCAFYPTAEGAPEGDDYQAGPLHLGNLLGIIILSWFLRCGHQVVAFLHEAKDDKFYSVSGISSTISRILERNHHHGVDSFSIMNIHGNWWENSEIFGFLTGSGAYANMDLMLAEETVPKREMYLDEGGLAFEVYPGLEVVRQSGYGLTFPPLLNSDGTKFGNDIWLSSSLLSPYQFYDYLFAVSDSDALRFLKMLTFLNMEEIAQIETEMQSPGYVSKTAQRRLAAEVTLFVHGEEGLEPDTKGISIGKA